MREMTKEEREVFERRKDIPRKKQRVADYFGMRWEDTEPSYRKHKEKHDGTDSQHQDQHTR